MVVASRSGAARGVLMPDQARSGGCCCCYFPGRKRAMEASSCYSRETVVVGLLSLRGGRSARQAPVSTVNQRGCDVVL
jgi:hypothetical protein